LFYAKKQTKYYNNLAHQGVSVIVYAAHFDSLALMFSHQILEKSDDCFSILLKGSLG